MSSKRGHVHKDCWRIYQCVYERASIWRWSFNSQMKATNRTSETNRTFPFFFTPVPEPNLGGAISGNRIGLKMEMLTLNCDYWWAIQPSHPLSPPSLDFKLSSIRLFSNESVLEMVGWHHWLNGHEFEQTLGVGDGQGSLVCCSPWGHKELDTTEWLSWNVGLHLADLQDLSLLALKLKKEHRDRNRDIKCLLDREPYKRESAKVPGVTPHHVWPMASSIW